MIHILLVDDEPFILEHLSTIPWDSTGVTDVHTAESALHALEIIRSLPIDLVITDIRMPGMSGIELCEKIREERREIICILLSGHAEFEYAKQAMKSGAVDYLLKPVENEEILQMVTLTVQQIHKERAEKSAVQNTMYTMRSQLPSLKSAFLNQIITGRWSSYDAIKESLSEFSIPFVIGEPVAIIMLRLDIPFTDMDEPNLKIYEFAVNNIAEETLINHFNIGSCKDEFNYLVFLAIPRQPFSSAKDNMTILDKLASELQTSVFQYLRGSISIALSLFGTFPDDLPKLYQQSLKTLQKLPGGQNAALIRLWEPPVPALFQNLQALYNPPALSQLYEMGRTEEAKEKMERIFQEVHEKGLDTKEHILEVFFYLSNAFSFIVHRWGKHLADVIERGKGMNVDPRDFRSMKQLQEWADTIHDSIVESKGTKKKNSQENLVRRVQLYIEHHIADVSLQTLADHLSLHPAYVSALYKQEASENLSDYILRYRMEKSGCMLRDTRLKIYEIAEQLGYQDTPYFSKLFKNHHHGVTPQDYRNHFN